MGSLISKNIKNLLAAGKNLSADKFAHAAVRVMPPCMAMGEAVGIAAALAVKHGGGTNHRMGLYDMAMIKDNHIKMAGGITKAVEQVRARIAEGIKIEVETTNLDEVKEAIAAGADIIMLDNMGNEAMAEAVATIKAANKGIKTEASGNMSIPRLIEVAATGVDYISVGALTHTVKAMDISMNIQVEK
jgi:nicotinate-nucleotide pyrophosphorylase (carboxylating)